jgi:hypothetical protein
MASPSDSVEISDVNGRYTRKCRSEKSVRHYVDQARTNRPSEVQVHRYDAGGHHIGTEAHFFGAKQPQYPADREI